MKKCNQWLFDYLTCKLNAVLTWQDEEKVQLSPGISDSQCRLLAGTWGLIVSLDILGRDERRILK